MSIKYYKLALVVTIISALLIVIVGGIQNTRKFDTFKQQFVENLDNL